MTRERLNFLFPAALLVAVALVQIARAGLVGQSAWKGGGFGMFSTTDTPGARFLRCSVRTIHGDQRVELPEAVADLARIARTVPTRANLEAVLAALDRGMWVEFETVGPAGAFVGSGPEPGQRDLVWAPAGTILPDGVVESEVVGVRLEAWKWFVDGDTMKVEIRKVAEAP